MSNTDYVRMREAIHSAISWLSRRDEEGALRALFVLKYNMGWLSPVERRQIIERLQEIKDEKVRNDRED